MSKHYGYTLTKGSIEKVSSGVEEFIKNDFGIIFPWLGEFKLEAKEKPLFEAQNGFESAVQIRIYRLWKRGIPQRCCIKFIYDTRNPDGLVEWSKESRDVMMALSNAGQQFGLKADIKPVDTTQPVHSSRDI